MRTLDGDPGRCEVVSRLDLRRELLPRPVVGEVAGATAGGTRKRQPVANRDLWEPLVELVKARGDVTFRWVKGHSGDPMNDLVDALAVAAAAKARRVG